MQRVAFMQHALRAAVACAFGAGSLASLARLSPGKRKRRLGIQPSRRTFIFIIGHCAGIQPAQCPLGYL